jgi:MFS family permease
VARVSTTAEAIKALWIRRGIVAPVWAALAFYSAGDAAFSGWAPSLLGRVYQVPTAEAGGLLGIVYIATGMGGTLLGGVVGDRLERKGGPSRRLLAACVGSILAILSGLTFIHGSTVSVLCCFGLWVFMANFCQVIGIAALQELLPGEMRGLNISCIAFVDLFLGSTSGTGATAVLTQYVFRSPLAVGSSIGLVGGFSALAAAVLFGRSLLRARSTPG